MKNLMESTREHYLNVLTEILCKFHNDTAMMYIDKFLCTYKLVSLIFNDKLGVLLNENSITFLIRDMPEINYELFYDDVQFTEKTNENVLNELITKFIIVFPSDKNLFLDIFYIKDDDDICAKIHSVITFDDKLDWD